jgi:hypothetical protein
VEVRYSGTAEGGEAVNDALQIVKPGSYTAKFRVRGTSSWAGLSADLPFAVAGDGSARTSGSPGFSATVSVNGSLSIPKSWFAGFDGFSEKFGGNLSKAATMYSGKTDASGAPMRVWQDFVAGTDPTDENSKLSTAIEFVEGRPKVTWTPNLNSGGGKRGARVYTVWGKESLDSDGWTPNADELPGDWKFFKVTVEMPK